MNTPVAISVLIRTIGRAEALKGALESLRAQTLRDFEVVIVEDGPPTLQAFLADYKDLPLYYEPLGDHQGRSRAGNRALALAQGEYCLFLDDDDALYPKHLEGLLAALRTSGRKVAYSWSEMRTVERAGDGHMVRQGRLKRYRRETFSLLHLATANFLPINAVLFHRSLYEAAGGFDEDLDHLEDWLLWLKYAAREPDWICVPEVTAIYYVPANLGTRRQHFRAHHGIIHERMQALTLSWPLATLRADIARHYAAAMWLRRFYYYLTSHLPRMR